MSDVIVSDSAAFTIQLDSKVYSLLVCQKALYALMRYISSSITVSGDIIEVVVTPVPNSAKSTEELKALINDELLDYSLRESIFEKTIAIRTLILSNAFSNTKLVG